MNKRLFEILCCVAAVGALVFLALLPANDPEYIVLADPSGACVGVDELRHGELYQKHTCREILRKVSKDEWTGYERIFVSPNLKGYSEKELSKSLKKK